MIIREEGRQVGQSDPLRAGLPPDTSLGPDVALRPAPQDVPALVADPDPFPFPEVDPDPEWTKYVAWVDRDIAAAAAGRVRPVPEGRGQ